MKVVRIDRYFTMGTTLMPNGTKAYCNIGDGDTTVRVRTSILVSVPDTATTEDVAKLSGEYLDALIDNAVKADWQCLGEGEDDRWEFEVTTAPITADIECVHDADGKLVVADEAIRWLVEPWEPQAGARDYDGLAAQIVQRMLAPEDRDDPDARRHCVSLLKPIREVVMA